MQYKDCFAIFTHVSSMNQEDLGQLLVSLRQKCGFTQEDISKKMHVTRQAVSKWENNTALPDVFTIVKLGKLYNTPLLSAFYGENFASEFNHVLKNRLIKRIIFIWLIISSILAIVLSIYIFKNNNLEDVYNLSYADEKIYIPISKIVSSKNKTIIEFNGVEFNFDKSSNNSLYEITLYYIESENRKIVFYTGKSQTIELDHAINYKKIFKKAYDGKIKLFIEIVYFNGQYNEKYQIEPKLELQSNNDFDQLLQEATSVTNEKCSEEYLLSQGFKRYDENNYYLDLSYKNSNECKFYLDSNRTLLKCNYNGYFYSIQDKLIYYSFNNNDWYTVYYDDKALKCVQNCKNLKEIKSIIEELMDLYQTTLVKYNKCNY